MPLFSSKNETLHLAAPTLGSLRYNLPDASHLSMVCSSTGQERFGDGLVPLHSYW